MLEILERSFYHMEFVLRFHPTVGLKSETAGGCGVRGLGGVELRMPEVRGWARGCRCWKETCR